MAPNAVEYHDPPSGAETGNLVAWNIDMNPKLTIAPEALGEKHPHLPFAVKHNLHENPLFEIPRLLELQKALPEDRALYYPGDVEVNTDRKTVPATGLSAEETIRRIRDCRSWMALRNVELDPTYRDLVGQTLESAQPALRTAAPGMTRPQGWIFITSPGAISPYHFDPEHNFLLQISGTKIIHVFDPTDRSILSELELERYYASGGIMGKLEYTEALQEKAHTFIMKPGDGVYIPVSAPHWVKVEDEVSISFSITYYSDEIIRRDRVYRLNARLRRMGITPAPYGRSPLRDSLKYSAIGTFLGAKRLLASRKQA
jgi:hypothetical protein